MRTDLFDFALPEDRIALRPVAARAADKLLEVRPQAAGELDDRSMRDLPALLCRGDALVVNDTKVLPAALHGRRIGRGDRARAIAVTIIERVHASGLRALAKR